MDQDLVTICMPVYNGERYIKDAINGVLNQSYKNFELLIIDDGSTDDTLSIIRSFRDGRIRIHCNGKNRGLTYTRNMGIGLAKGAFLAFNDSDDISMPERIRLQVELLKTYPEIGICGSSAYLIDESNKLIGNIKVVTGESNYLKCLLLFSNLFVNSTLIFRIEVLKDKTYELPLSEDYELTTRLVSEGIRITNLNLFLIKYRTHASNISKLKAEQIRQNDLIILKKQLKQLDYIPTWEELILHYSFLSNDYHLFSFGQVQNWLLKLEELNEIKNIYPKKLFLKTLCLQLYKYVKYKKSRSLYIKMLNSKIFYKFLLSLLLPL